MLGALASTKDIGIYDQALKIGQYFAPTLVTSLGSVMLPRYLPISYQLEITRL